MQTTDTVLGTPSTMGDDEQLTTTRLLRDAARTFGDQQIIHTRGGGSPWQTTTYAAVWERVRRMAAALRAEGVIPPGLRFQVTLPSASTSFISQPGIARPMVPGFVGLSSMLKEATGEVSERP